MILENQQVKKDNIFPIGIFPKFIQEYIKELQLSLNFHPDFTGAAVMFAISTIIGNKYKLRVKQGWDAAPIFWFACAGYPGTIKTHPIKTIMKPIIKLDIESKRNWDAEMAHYNPDSIPRQPKPKFKQILISDFTIEALHSVHNINKRGVGLYKDELNGFLNDMNRYRKGSDEEFWLESFNNGSYIVNRVTKDPVLISDIFIPIIGTIQHDVLGKIIAESSGNGLLDRFLFTAPESKIYHLNNNHSDEVLTQQWDLFIHRLHNSTRYIDSEDTQIIHLTGDAFKEYQRIDQVFVMHQSNEETPMNIKNYLSKMKTYVPRFALLIGVMDSLDKQSPISVSYKHMVLAGILADYFIETARQTFSFNLVQIEIKELVGTMKALTQSEKIQKLHQKGISVTELARYFSVSKQYVSKLTKPKGNQFRA